MNLSILDRIKRINRLIEMHPADLVLAMEICGVLCEELSSFVLLIDGKGLILGHNKPLLDDTVVDIFDENEGEYISGAVNARLLNILSIDDNVSHELLGIDVYLPFHTIVVPVSSASVRVATMIIYRLKEKFDLDDIIYVEHAKSLVATIFGGIELDKSRQVKRAKESLDKGILSLSSAELSAAGFVLDSLDSEEGIVVAKEVAYKYGISRSVIVAALKKLESAGVVDCRSVGNRGTYIKITNEFLRDSIDTLVEKN